MLIILATLVSLLQDSTTTTDQGWLSVLLDLASKLTLTVGLVISVWALVTGKIIPPSRLKDWQERAKYEQDRADRLEAALKDSTGKIESNTNALVALRDVLATINK